MSGNPVGLVEFLTQRLDDEEVAWSGGLDLATRPEFARLAQHQLADIAAKRRIIERCRDKEWLADVPGHHAMGLHLLAQDTLHALAAPFSSHPDWQPEWSTE